ncbi:hypothetical protein ACFLZW_07070 [Chloroflexota bacterium]
MTERISAKSELWPKWGHSFPYGNRSNCTGKIALNASLESVHWETFALFFVGVMLLVSSVVIMIRGSIKAYLSTRKIEIES